MARRSRHCCIAGLLAGALQPGLAQAPAREQVIVVGNRAGLESAQVARRDGVGIVDAVFASDITRLPDLSASDAAQRIPGVQIVRDRGEGSVLSVRGLVQIETLLNGREIFSAGGTRTLDFADIAAELLSGIEVHKTASAERIEGGIGGSVNLRTRRPFDLGADAAALTARVIHGDLVRRSALQATGLWSRRTALDGGGEFGILVNLALQQRAWREDQKSTGNPLQRDDLVPGQTVFVPNGTSETVSSGERRRSAAGLVLQWRPVEGLALLAEAHHARLDTEQDSQQINITAGSGFVPGSVVLFPGSSDLRSITWTDAPFSVLSFARDTVDRFGQLALGATWRAAPWQFEADWSRTESRNHLYFAGPMFAGRVARFSQDLAGALPATAVAGTDLLDPANLAYTGIAYRTRPFSGRLDALRLDAAWAPATGWFERFAFGARLARRNADNEPGLLFADAALSGIGAADTPGRVMPLPAGDFLGGRGHHVGPFLVGRLDDARDALALRQAFGITQPLPDGASPLARWRLQEHSDALYSSAELGFADGALRLQPGLRWVQTRLVASSAQTVSGSSIVEPIEAHRRSTAMLPSLNLRHRLGPAWQWRAAASRTVTRPDFDRLSPALTLTPNTVNPTLNQGTAGNPALEPVRSRNVDVALEFNGSAGQAASLTLFHKRIEGFIASFSQPELHADQIYQVSRPYNSDPAELHGLELVHQGFLDALPSPWRGLGWQANYTFVDSRTYDRRVGGTLPLQNLSRHSGNLVLMFEQGGFAARLAWNRRSEFLSGAGSFVGVGAVGIWTRGYDWLDASLDWRLAPGLTLALEGGNLTRTLRSSYNGLQTRPQSAFMNDRQLALRLSLQR